MSSAVCAACRRAIDETARICPYCGSNPATGERVIDTQAILQEVFRPREVTTSESVIEYARQRQGVVVAVSLGIAFLVLAGLHQFVRMRNERDVTNTQAVPLTEIADLADQTDESAPVPMPELDFQYDGRPQAMRTYIVERGATTPAGPPAPQTPQAAAAAAAPQAKAGVAPPPPAARPPAARRTQ